MNDKDLSHEKLSDKNFNDKNLSTKKKVFVVIGGIVLVVALIATFIALRPIYFPTEAEKREMAKRVIDPIILRVKARAYATNMDIYTSLTGYKQDTEFCGENGESCSGWGEWIMKAAKLDSTKWAFSNNALSPKTKSGELCGYIFEFVLTSNNYCHEPLGFLIDINKIDSNERFCQNLKTSYKSEPFSFGEHINGSSKFMPLLPSCNW